MPKLLPRGFAVTGLETLRKIHRAALGAAALLLAFVMSSTVGFGTSARPHRAFIQIQQAVLLSASAPASVASASAVPSPPAAAPAPPPPRSQADDVLSRIHYPWQQLGYTISFEGPRAGLLGGTIPSTHQIIAFVRPGEPTDLITHVIAHEIGHAIDKTYNTPARRQQWLQLRGVSPNQPWFTCSGCLDFATPAGDFAETFAAWQLGVQSRSTLAPPPDAATMVALSRLFSP
jgi:hypothetical protein